MLPRRALSSAQIDYQRGMREFFNEERLELAGAKRSADSSHR
jgi:hypothetical protein